MKKIIIFCFIFFFAVISIGCANANENENWSDESIGDRTPDIIYVYKMGEKCERNSQKERVSMVFYDFYVTDSVLNQVGDYIVFSGEVKMKGFTFSDDVFADIRFLGEEVESSVTFEKELSSQISDPDISNKTEGMVSFVFSLPSGTLETLKSASENHLYENEIIYVYPGMNFSDEGGAIFSFSVDWINLRTENS